MNEKAQFCFGIRKVAEFLQELTEKRRVSFHKNANCHVGPFVHFIKLECILVTCYASLLIERIGFAYVISQPV